MKILYVTTISETMNFFPEHIKMLQSKGHTVELACNCHGPLSAGVSALACKVHPIPFSRMPLSKDNLRAYKQLKALLENEKYDIVHTHTPNASVCTRLAGRKLRRHGLSIFYTAHGFHFHRGAPLKNWVLYYPVEWICAHWTDTLITINREDYGLAQRHMHAKRIEYVPGVGIERQKFGSAGVDIAKKRSEIGIPRDSIMLLSVGELNENKNHQTVIRAIVGMNVYYVIAGEGGKKDALRALAADLGIAEKVKLLGFQEDVQALYEAADLFVFPSYREGLPVSLMEAMAKGLPVACSRIRGNTDLMDEQGGALFNPHCVQSCQKALARLLCEDRKKFGLYNAEKAKQFEMSITMEKHMKIYDRMMQYALERTTTGVSDYSRF